MDIRDILKSFDNLSEATTTTDKGKVHTSEPGGYGNKHGSEDVKDQYGKPVGRMSLGKLGAKNEPKRGKGRPPNPDKAKEYDSTGLNKAMGIGKAPKPTGKPSVKHSLKEYFDQMDEALYEAALAVQPLPATAQQKQQQQMAGKPSFMIKDPANPSAPAITTQDPAVVQAAKNGTMSMQKPGATPAAGAGSQVAPMKEGGDVGKHNNATTGFDALVRKLTPKYGKEAATKIAGAQLKKMSEAEQPQHFAQSSPLSTANRGVLEGEGDFGKAIGNLNGWYEVDPDQPNTRQYKFDDQEDEYYADGTVIQDLKTGKIKVEFNDKAGEYGGNNINDTFNSIGDAMNALRTLTTQKRYSGGKSYSRDSLASKSLAGPDDVYKTDRAGKIGTLTKSRMGNMKASSQYTMRGGPKGVLPEGKKGVNPFAKKDTKKKPDADKDGVPDWADKKPGKDDNEGKKKGAAPKKGVNPFAKKTEKKKDNIAEGIMDNIKGMLVPKLMKLLGPDAEQIANAVKQATGGDFTPSKENAIKVVKALGIDKAASQGQSQQMAEGIAGNWQGKLIQALYTLGLLGAGAAAATMWGTVGGSFMANIGTVLLMFANTFFGDAPGQIGAYGKFGNKGTSAQRGLDDNGMPIRNMNVDESTKKKKVKEGMEHHLQAARLEGKSHALRKMPYNCSHDDMEEARCYHDGFKEGLDECYGQMPILGRTRVGEMGQGPEVATMASYGADDMGEAMYDEGADELGEMDKTSYMKQQAIKTPGDTFKAFGQTMRDSNVLDEFAFEALDKQLNAILEGKEVSEGMTVSISKGQQGSPDSVSVSAQDGEADQLLSIIKSAGMGLFGGDEQNGYGAPQGSAGAHGGISVVDDHDGMMALMKKLSGGGEMQGGGDYEDEEGHEGHGKEDHMHGEEETCNECGGMMEENHQCGSQEMVDEVESEDQMEFEVSENAPDSGADNTNADVAGNAAANSALATADAGADEEEGQVYSSPTEGKEDTTGEEAGKEEEKKEMSESSFFNLFKKISMLSEESTDKEEDEKAEKAGKKVANDIEYDEGHKGKDDNKAEKAGKKVTKDIEYDDKKDEKYKKDKKVDESYANSADDTFEADIDFMTKVISGGLNKQKSTGQTTIPVINGQKNRMGVDGLGSPMKESTDLLRDYRKLSGL